jgi:hypothetical protein
MNPLFEDAIGFLRNGRHFSRINQNKTGTMNWNVEFVFSDGTNDTRHYQCDDATFMEWWKLTTGYLRSAAHAFDKVDGN